jgi:hypothetical protein|tara:strand:+ start:1331 stop:1999 length:669 start_codon:yes stop_codon:yes gene_type:complete
MRQYILEKVRDTTRHFKFGNIDVQELEPTPDTIDLASIFKTLENNFPSHYFNSLKGIKIGHTQEFDDRDVNAVYRSGTFHITNRQDNTKDLMDDIVHEFAHHMETLFPELIYSDEALIREFRRKRHELRFELQSEGYWVDEYDFDNLKFNEKYDVFLYKRVGPNMLRSITTGLFIRPYAAVSLREYFATGFEAYYLGKQDTLEKISPMLYDKITELHNHSEY